jgi:excisionase family DNA binding protein
VSEPPAVAERYITAAELAERMGVSLSTIRRWTAAGMPSETWGMGHTRRYLASQCIEWARARVDTIGRNIDLPAGAQTPLGTDQRRRSFNG